jgi:hypothetical protein
MAEKKGWSTKRGGRSMLITTHFKITGFFLFLWGYFPLGGKKSFASEIS